MKSLKELSRGKAIQNSSSKRKKESAKKHGKNLIFCPDCGIVYFNKAWHHNLRNLKSVKENADVKFVLCPACTLAKNKDWLGEVLVVGLGQGDFSGADRIIARSRKIAFEKDPLDRILKQEFNASKKTLRIFVSEGQLAHRLAKELKKAFPKSIFKIANLNSERLTKATIEFRK